MPLLPQQLGCAWRPSSVGASKKGEGQAWRLTEYQQLFPGTPAFCNPIDVDVNQELVSSKLARHRAPKKPSLMSSTAYSESFKRPSSQESQLPVQHPWVDSVGYKRSTATPKSHSHEQHRLHQNVSYAMRKKCHRPQDHLTTGGTCDFWASSYQIAHAGGDSKKNAPDKDPQQLPAVELDTSSSVSALDMSMKDSWKHLFAASSQIAPCQNLTASQSETSLRVATAPTQSRHGSSCKMSAQLPSVKVRAGRGRCDQSRSDSLHNSTPNLPLV